MKLACSFISIIFVSITSPGAVNKVGNGGDGIFCKNTGNEKSPGKLLDFYEDKIILETSVTNPEVIAETQLTHLKNVAPKLAEQYLKRLKEISKEIEYMSKVSLIDIKDSKHLFKPLENECQVLQITIRKAKTISNEKPFLIREDLWKQLSPLQQAGLLTHEIIYEHLAKLGEEDSIKARKINRFLYQSEFKKEEFWKFIKELELPIYP